MVHKANKYLNLTILLLSFVLAATVLLACDNEDDIGSIFSGKTWYVSGAEINSTPISGDELKSFYAVQNSYFIFFASDLSFSGVLTPGSSIAGTWYANGKNNGLKLDFNKAENVSESAVSANIYNILKGATAYSGDENNIKIKKDNHNYVRLTNSRNSNN